MADFLDVKLREIDARLRELRPLVEEHKRLEAARRALEQVAGDQTPRRRSTRGGGAKSRSDPSRPAARQRGRGSRSDQALALVQGRPGMTIRQIADEMGVAPNYLYRVMPSLEAAGRVARDGNGWVAAASP